MVLLSRDVVLTMCKCNRRNILLPEVGLRSLQNTVGTYISHCSVSDTSIKFSTRMSDCTVGCIFCFLKIIIEGI